MNKEDFVSELSKIRPSSTFLYLQKYNSLANELANFSIIFHISYQNALKKSIAILENMVPNSMLQAEAKHSVLLSFHDSLEKCQTIPVEEIDDAYTRFFDSDGSYIKGVKLHARTSTLHLYGFVHKKQILMPGIYKKVNSAPLTIEKEKLRRMTPLSKFRQFKITPNQLEKISVEGLNLLPPQ